MRIVRGLVAMRGLVALLALLASLAATGVRAGADGRGRFVIEPTEMRREIGKAWTVTLPPEWQTTADDPAHPQRSGAVLLEDGRPLGPAHAIHQTIRDAGGGAYSHWFELLYFSTSDGSDPRTNGREYVVEDGPRPPPAAGSRPQSEAGTPAPGAREKTTE
jgi:hypothetical protein